MRFSLILRCAIAAALVTVPSLVISAPPETLPGTASLDWPEEDLSSRMMDGAHHFVERQIAQARDKRSRYWKYDSSSVAAWEASIHENRERLREIIGAVDRRAAPRMERFGDDD